MADPDVPPTGVARPVAVYTVSRAALLAGCLGLGWLVGFRGVVLVLVALVVSGLIALVLLQRQRFAMSAAVDGVVRRMRERSAARTAAEDAYAERLHAEQR